MIELYRVQRRKFASIKRKYGIRLILAFGSQVSGLVHPDSDLDIGIFYEGEQKPLDVAAALQTVFPGSEVDLVNLNRADPLLLNEVNKGCQLLAGDETDFQNFRIHAFHRYQDYQPFLLLEAKLNSRKLAGLTNGR
jgi:predicted nucleotidyltransferase